MSGGKSKRVTVGYRYYFSIAMGLCREVDGIKEIKVGGKPLLRMGATPSDDTNPLLVGIGPVIGAPASINRPDLFGGDKGEGGIQGGYRFITGKTVGLGGYRDAPTVYNYASQRNPYGPPPSYADKAVFFYDGLITSMNPYPKPWSFRVCRYQSGVGSVEMGDRDYPPGILTAGGYVYGANPAHALAEILIDKEWGRGLSTFDVDWPSFRRASQVLLDEDMAFCLSWRRDGDMAALAQTIIDQIGGVLFQSPETGQITLKLIRDDYIAETLPVFTPGSGLMSVEENALPVGEATVNEVIVNYTDPISGEEMSVREQNTASIQSSGGIRSVTTQYPGCPTGTLAARLAKRDLDTKGARNLRVLRFHLDQRGYWVVPGDVIRLDWPELNINNMVVRIGAVVRLPDGRVDVRGAEDLFGLPTRANALVPEIPPEVPVLAPGEIVTYTVYEAPYAEVMYFGDEEEGAGDLSPTEGILISRVAQPAEGINARYRMTSGPSNNRLEAPGDYAGHALVAPGFILGETGPSLHIVEDPASTGRYQSIRAGTIIKVNDEYMRVSAVSDIVPGLPSGARNLTVQRGGFDTIPKRHEEGASVWIIWGSSDDEINAGYAVQEEPYTSGTSGTSVSVSLTPQTLYEAGVARTTTAMFDRRYTRPYPPADVRLQSTTIWGSAQAIGDVTLTWAGRNRITQDTAFVSHTGANVPLEAGASTQVRLYNDDTNTLLKSLTTDSILTFTYTEAESIADGSPKNLRVELYSTRDGLNSRDRYIHRFTHVHTGDDVGWGFRYGNNYGGPL